MDRNPYTPPEASVAVNEQLRPANRPPEVKKAIQLLWGSLAIGPINLALDWSHLSGLMPMSNVLITLGLTVALFGWLTAKIGVGRNWARVTFLVLMVLGLPFTALMLVATLKRTPAEGVLQIVQALMQIYSLYLLFAVPGKSWFQRRKEIGT